jgi:hypothetical protein
LGAKVETNDQGGSTTTIVYATDDYVRDIIAKNTIAIDAGSEEADPGQLLEILEDSPQGEEVSGGDKEVFGSYLPENVDQCSGYYTWNDLIETFNTLDKNVI